jgi:hypothetical protein
MIHIGLAQMASSASNILAIVLVAHYSRGHLTEFRIASLVFALNAFVIGIVRIVCVEPILLKWTNARVLTGRATRLAIVGVPIVVAVLGISRGLPSISGIAYVAALPALTCQEALRGAFFAAGRASEAARMDVAWLVLMCVGLIGVRVTALAPTQPGEVVLVWAAAGSLSLLFGYVLWIHQPRSVAVGAVAAERRKDLISLAASAAVAGAAVPIASILLNLFNRGLVAADWRTSASIFSPLNILASSMHIYVVPRAVKTSGDDLVRWIRRYQVSLIALSVGWCAILQILVWTGLVSSALGEPWSRVRPYLMLLFASQILLGVAGGLFISHRLRGRPGLELRSRGLYAIATSLLVPLGAYRADLKGALLGASIAGGIAIVYAGTTGWRDRRSSI